MLQLLWLIVAIPFASAALLALFGSRPVTPRSGNHRRWFYRIECSTDSAGWCAIRLLSARRRCLYAAPVDMDGKRRISA